MNRRYRRRDERGAVALVVALVTVAVVLPIAAMTVDLGMQRVARRDMQALADMVALDMSRQLDGVSKYAELRVTAQWKDGIRRSAARNLGLSEAQAVNGPGRLNVDLAADGTAVVVHDSLRLEVSAGRVDPGSGDFTVSANQEIPEAVRVVARTSVDFAFASGSGGVGREAIAAALGGACFKIGSYAAALDSGASPVLGPLLDALGSNAVLSVADYRALADVDVTLVDLLAAKAGAITLEEAIAGDQLVRLSDFYLATASALARGGGNAAEVALLESIAASVAPLSVAIPVADLVRLSTSGAAGLQAALNVLDLVTAGAAAATGTSGVAIDRAGVDLGPLTDVDTTVNVIEPPAQACGRVGQPDVTAESSAIRVGLAGSALDLQLGLLSTDATLTGAVTAATADGTLTDIRCGPEGITVHVSDGLLTVDLTVQVQIDAIFGLIPAVSGPIRLTGQSDSNGDAVITINSASDYDTPVRVSNSSSGLPTINVDTSGLTALGLPVGASVLNVILDPLLDGLVNPIVDSLDTALLTPLLKEMGMDLSGADVFAIPAPQCDLPRLAG